MKSAVLLLVALAAAAALVSAQDFSVHLCGLFVFSLTLILEPRFVRWALASTTLPAPQVLGSLFLLLLLTLFLCWNARTGQINMMVRPLFFILSISALNKSHPPPLPWQGYANPAQTTLGIQQRLWARGSVPFF